MIRSLPKKFAQSVSFLALLGVISSVSAQTSTNITPSTVAPSCIKIGGNQQVITYNQKYAEIISLQKTLAALTGEKVEDYTKENSFVFDSPSQSLYRAVRTSILEIERQKKIIAEKSTLSKTFEGLIGSFTSLSPEEEKAKAMSLKANEPTIEEKVTYCYWRALSETEEYLRTMAYTYYSNGRKEDVFNKDKKDFDIAVNGNPGSQGQNGLAENVDQVARRIDWYLIRNYLWKDYPIASYMPILPAAILLNHESVINKVAPVVFEGMDKEMGAIKVKIQNARRQSMLESIK
ncbi:MAG: hypothetical protein ACJAS1_000824 [Oleiphilaceae bacterium]|jgi:hypothetical protein